MPQIMIDTAAESAESLRLLSVLLVSYAGFKDAQDASDRQAGESVAPTVAAAIAAHTHQQPVTVAHTTAIGDVSETTTVSIGRDPATVFAKPVVVPQGTDTNVVQLFPGAPTLPVLTTQTPATSAAQLPATDMPANLSTATTGAQGATLPPAQTATVELDKAGIPWDARIHQSNRNKKADGTWMLKRGLDKALAESVLAELTAAKLTANTPAAPAAGPVSLPPPPVSLPGGLPIPPAGTLPPPPAGAQLPPVLTGLPTPPAVTPATLTPVQRFSAMMVKINAARTSGQIDQNMIDEAHKALDLPQLQLAITQPDKIPLIEAALGL